jgi:hypothetical protein
MEAAMSGRRTIMKAISLLLSVALVLSACATAPDYGAVAYPGAYNGYEGYPYNPIYGSLGFGFGGFDRFHHDRDFGHGHADHDFAEHAGHGFARFGQHGFAAHGGFGHGSFGGHHG